MNIINTLTKIATALSGPVPPGTTVHIPIENHEFEMKRTSTSSLPWPGYGTPGSAGLDLAADISAPITIQPGQVEFIGSGIAIHIKDPNIGGFVYPRSGKGAKEGIVLANTVGVIDSDYQGEIKIAVLNRNTDKPVTINPGDKIAQLVFHQITRPSFKIVEAFDGETQRGAGGFGSTDTPATPTMTPADIAAVYNGMTTGVLMANPNA